MSVKAVRTKTKSSATVTLNNEGQEHDEAYKIFPGNVKV